MNAPAAFAAPPSKGPTSGASQKKTSKNTKARKPKTAPRPESPSPAAATPAVARTASAGAAATTKTTAGAPESSDGPAPSPSGDPVAIDAATIRGSTPLRTAGYVGLGAGVLALGTGAVLGIMAANERSELAARCPNDVCSSADRTAYDRGHAQADAATLVIAAGALVTAGSVALIVFGGSKKESDPSALSARLRAGPTGVFVSGTFQ